MKSNLNEILKKHKLSIKINNDDLTLTLFQEKAFFLETDLYNEIEFYRNEKNLKDLIIKTLEYQIKSDLEWVEQNIKNTDIIQVVSYTKECYELYEDLIK